MTTAMIIAEAALRVLQWVAPAVLGGLVWVGLRPDA